jgi:hypothetical protein
MYYLIEPEVAGGLGDNTVIDTNFHPPIVISLEYRFEGWLGDDILESFPCFLITEFLSAKLLDPKLTGITVAPVLVTQSEESRELNPDVSLPKFFWLKVVGVAGTDDFGLSEDHRLVISQAGLDIFRTARLDNADITKYR